LTKTFCCYRLFLFVWILLFNGF